MVLALVQAYRRVLTTTTALLVVVVPTSIYGFRKGYHPGRIYKDSLYINMNTKRLLYFRSEW